MLDRYKTISVSGFKGAIIGMREPMDSHYKSDSLFGLDNVSLGDNDLKLCKALIFADSAEHRKFLRMIHVQVEINNPRYWWEEMATYKVGTVFNSQSTMHKLLNTKNRITIDLFDTDCLDKGSRMLLSLIVDRLEQLRLSYLLENSKEEKTRMLCEAKHILPECFLQKRMVDFNYEVIRNICSQRKHHRLQEWTSFIEWAKTLPYAEELIFYKKEKKEDTVNGKV